MPKPYYVSESVDLIYIFLYILLLYPTVLKRGHSPYAQ